MFELILTLKVFVKMGLIWGSCAIGLFIILAAITEVTGSKTWLRSLLSDREIERTKTRKLKMIDITVKDVKKVA